MNIFVLGFREKVYKIKILSKANKNLLKHNKFLFYITNKVIVTKI